LREKVAEAAFVVPISQYNRDVIELHCGASSRNRLNVIHCGVDTKVFSPSDRAHRKCDTDPLRILSVGTLHEVKGQTFLIEACRRLAERGVDFECHLVGDGPDRAALMDQIRKAGLERRVQLVGQKTRQEIVALLAEADVFVAPSVPSRSGRKEGIPVVLMEAMACGIAVVASDLSGIPELVVHQRSGLLTQPRDVNALANALERLARDDELRRELGQAARATVLEDFDQSKNAWRLSQCFTEASSR
jgi:glycosyltransferase involved in cell wall biosynthesis